MGQEYLLGYELKYPGTTMLNIPIRFRIRDNADLQNLADKISEVIRSHPALLSTIEPSGDGSFMQRYVPAFDTGIKVEKMADEELEEMIRWLVENNIWIDPEGCCSIMKDDAEYAGASLVINDYKIAIDPYGDTDKKNFESEGYTVISSDDLDTLKSIITRS